ncbi:uncharacterized protein LOC135094684 isoform X1 [Scylla paramamosain]|uniref:uncharacterized protein LOC135094684 isoform X1 n=1 Tax=Scylla paramamosain TaxID=85552 RepID=UPI0030826C3F
MKKTARKTSNVIGWRLVVGCCDWWTRGSCGRAVCVLCEGWQLCPCHRGLDIEVTTGLQYNISMAHQTLPLTLGALRCLVNTSLLHSCPSQPSYTSCPSCECEGHLHVFISVSGITPAGQKAKGDTVTGVVKEVMQEVEETLTDQHTKVKRRGACQLSTPNMKRFYVDKFTDVDVWC